MWRGSLYNLALMFLFIFFGLCISIIDCYEPSFVFLCFFFFLVLVSVFVSMCYFIIYLDTFLLYWCNMARSIPYIHLGM